LTKRRKNEPNRLQKKDKSGLFSFDPVRRDVLIWGIIAGTAGGFLMIQQQLVWQILGVFVVVFVANYHISKAARYIPRWQAALLSFIGMSLAMFGVIVMGTIIIAYFSPAGG
jgi:hypothetical protein